VSARKKQSGSSKAKTAGDRNSTGGSFEERSREERGKDQVPTESPVAVSESAGAATSAPEHSLEKEMAVLRESGLFLEAWYLGYYRDISAAGKDALEHFCRTGWREGRKPNPRFDSKWYIQAYGEMIGNVNPLLDYVVSGEGLGRKPAPDFDPMEYRFRHGLAYADSPLRHHLAQRAEAVPGYDTLPEDFDSALYLEANPDVARAGLDPAWHFIHHGKAEGRQLKPAGVR
jgi:hypothetical protein